VVAAWLVSAIVVALILVGVLFQLAGGRWFIVQTPSMGETAPVGTLVLTQPTTVSALHVGDIITFHPPTEPSAVFTHRISAISASGGVTTRGDANGATDPWVLHDRDLVGRASLVAPQLGWLVKAIPLLFVGFALVWLIARSLRSATTRAAFRILGATFVVSLVAFILHPFVSATLVASRSSHAGAHAVIASTGILPIRVSAAHGTSVHLVSGQVGEVSFPAQRNGYYQLASSLDLPWWGWVILGVICATPLLWCLIVGLPPRPEKEADA
jgi:signal peptidase I